MTVKLHQDRYPVAAGEIEVKDDFLGAGKSPGTAVGAVPAEEATPAAATVSPLRPLNAVMPHGSTRAVHMAEVAEVEALNAQQTLTSFRSMHAFSYSANLLFHRTALSYYITLSQDGRLWRALHAAEFESAELAFRHFEEQVVRLADAELRRAHLEAQNQQLVAEIEASEALAERLRNDLDAHAAQTQLVTSRQQQVRKEVAQLETQRIGTQAILNKTLRQIRQLRATSNERVPHLPTRRAES
ncbi:hypothetical protein WI80_14285 [Burkholderia ubonensis]|nr:hypothetical protein WI80_14285 [Burkholderia ubonensis]KVU24407.1 hypothetical protein WK63_26850 [Burkholderia ubonensis]